MDLTGLVVTGVVQVWSSDRWVQGRVELQVGVGPESPLDGQFEK